MSAAEQPQSVEGPHFFLSPFGVWSKSGDSLSLRDSDLSLLDTRASFLLYIKNSYYCTGKQLKNRQVITELRALSVMKLLKILR